MCSPTQQSPLPVLRTAWTQNGLVLWWAGRALGYNWGRKEYVYKKGWVPLIQMHTISHPGVKYTDVKHKHPHMELLLMGSDLDTQQWMTILSLASLGAGGPRGSCQLLWFDLLEKLTAAETCLLFRQKMHRVWGRFLAAEWHYIQPMVTGENL